MKERFETRLTPEEAGRVEVDMMRLGARSRAAYLHDCLLAGSAGRAEALARQLGVLGILPNALVRMGETRRPWIERGDRHIRCELADGTIVAIGTDSMHLTGPLPPQPGRWRRFARAFCLRMGWAEVNTGTGLA